MTIVSKIHGGLGNQMFQYSIGRCLADKLGTELHLDTSAFAGYHRKYLLDCFNIRANFTGTTNVQAPVVRERRSFEYNEEVLNTTSSVQLEGYWQNEKYFRYARQQILKDFTPLKEYRTALSDRINTSDSVSVHYRRGDYLSIACVQNICTEAYYTVAMDYIRACVYSPLFVLFSDDQTWLQNVKLENAIICTVTDPVESLVLMSMCKHNTLCNSSFSWWGSWLNNNPDKIAVSPKIWFNGISTDPGYIIDSWVKM